MKTDWHSVEVPVLKPGRYLRGPDFYGCFNTGTAPIIIRPAREAVYLVGPEMTTLDTICKTTFAKNKRVFRFGKDTVYRFKTKAAAVAKFRELAGAAQDRNDEIIKQHQADREAAKRGDLAAIARLGDY